jgi:hypothetical protein
MIHRYIHKQTNKHSLDRQQAVTVGGEEPLLEAPAGEGPVLVGGLEVGGQVEVGLFGCFGVRVVVG